MNKNAAFPSSGELLGHVVDGLVLREHLEKKVAAKTLQRAIAIR